MENQRKTKKQGFYTDGNGSGYRHYRDTGHDCRTSGIEGNKQIQGKLGYSLCQDYCYCNYAGTGRGYTPY